MTNNTAIYGISDEHGNDLSVGLQPHLARKIAQDRADDLGICVYLWQRGDLNDPEEFCPIKVNS